MAGRVRSTSGDLLHLSAAAAPAALRGELGAGAVALSKLRRCAAFACFMARHSCGTPWQNEGCFGLDVL